MSTTYLSEIRQQPEVIARVADNYPERDPALLRAIARLQNGAYRHVILTGMGSSLYGCYPFLLALSRRSIPTTMWDASELLHHADGIITSETLLIVVSQSGESAEIKGLTTLRRRAGLILGLTNTLGSSLAKWADVVLDMRAGDETTVATKTYSATLASLYMLSSQILQGDVSAARNQLHHAAICIHEFLREWEEPITQAFSFLNNSETLVLLGRGESLATALTGALVLQEASKLFALGLSAGQFRHGPLELVRLGFRAVLFTGGSTTREMIIRLAHDIASYGGKALLVTSVIRKNEVSGIHEVRIPTVADALLPLVEIVPLQLLAIPLATIRGFEAGTFERCGKVTTAE